MQHDKKPSKFKQVMKSRGYYIVLFLCFIAVGTSGYLYYRNSDNTTSQTAVQKPSETAGESGTTTPSSETKQPATSGAKDAISDDTVQAADAQQEEPEEKAMQVSAPLDGQTVQGYAMDHLAYNETTKDWRTHAGIDIAGNLGDEVHAAADGVVYAVYDDDLLGKTVVINHASDYRTYYSNLAEDVKVTAGDTVTTQTVLGTVGDTAIVEVSTQPHLHFAVYCDSNIVDPLQFLAQ